MFIQIALNEQRAKGLHTWSNSEYIWPNVQRKWPNACAFNQLRAHLTNCIRIWPLLVGSTKCAAYLGKRAAIWPNARLRAQMHAHLTKCCTFGQMLRVLSIGQMRSAFAQMRFAFGQMRCADWSNAPYIIILVTLIAYILKTLIKSPWVFLFLELLHLYS